jgi:arsenate reductase
MPQRRTDSMAEAARTRYVTGMAMTIFHNPQCSKSRGALGILNERGIPHEVVEYLKTPPDRGALARILALLGGPPGALVRRDARWRELGLAEGDVGTREQVIEVLLRHPELMERPVVVAGDRAVIARPPERVVELLDGE